MSTKMLDIMAMKLIPAQQSSFYLDNNTVVNILVMRKKHTHLLKLSPSACAHQTDLFFMYNRCYVQQKLPKKQSPDTDG